LGNDFSDSVILAEGYVMAPGESLISPYTNRVSPGYFETMRIPLHRGRFFSSSDDARAPGVVIIDERLARRFFASTDPVGRRLWQPQAPEELVRGPGPKARFYTIVGVVGSVRTRALTEKEPVGAYYFPIAQDMIRAMTLVARSAMEPEQLTQSIRREISALDPELPFYGVRPMRARVDDSLLSRRTPMMLGSMFAAIALFLASVGIYGVLAYQVSQRRKEIGIRLALGSQPGRIFGLVLQEGVVLLVSGLGLGLAGALALRRAIETQLFGVQSTSPAVLGAVIAVLVVVVVVACGLPARRAARIDPLIALTEQ
jgi:predicted permease